MGGIGVPEIVIVLLPLILGVVAVVSIAVANWRRDRANDHLPVLLQVADWSGPHPACPRCKSVSFHPVAGRSQPIFVLVLGFLAVGGASTGTLPGLIACTVCGRRYRQA